MKIYVPFILFLSFLIPIQLLADNTTLSAELTSSGGGGQEIVWDTDNWQQITYNYEINLEFDVVYNMQRGDIYQYIITGLRGTVHFWGDAEDNYYGSYTVWDVNDIHNYDIDISSDGLLEYSISKGRVTYLQTPLSGGNNDILPYYLQFYGLSHPQTTRLWVSLAGNWYFDEDYDSCTAGIGVDMTDSSILTPHADIAYDSSKFQYNSAYPGNWRMVALDASVQASFTLDSVPSSATLVIDHLSSAVAACPGGGYSPVNIIVNGNTIASCYDPAENHGGVHSFVTDQWEIAPFLHSGSNNVIVQICNTACSYYWIRYLYVNLPWDDCASCVIPRLPTLNIMTAKMVSPIGLGADIEVWYPEDIPETALRKVKFWATINGVFVEQIFDITRLVEPGIKKIINFDYGSQFIEDPVPPRVIDLEQKGVPRFEKHETFKIYGVAFWENGPPSKEANTDVDILLPVIILHGYTFTHTIGGSFIEIIKFTVYAGLMSFLDDYGYTTDNTWYRTMWGPLDCSYQADKETIQSIEQTVDHWVERALRETYANRVDFVGHSTGGLVARYYAGNSSKVNKVITVGTPHLGVTDFFNQAFVKETKEEGEALLFKPGTNEYNLLLWFDPNYPNSSLVRIGELGGYEEVSEPFDKPQYEPYKFHPIYNPDVKYYSIFANHNNETLYQLVVEDRGSEWYNTSDTLSGWGDGYILAYSAGAFFPTFPPIREGVHAKLCLQKTVQHRILHILTDKEDIISDGASSAWYTGTVLPSESASHSFSITGSPVCVQVDLTWPGSCLQLSLQDPNGEVINPQRAMVDPNMEFIQGSTFEQYVIYFPKEGDWQILVTAVDVLPEGEIYDAVVYLTDANASNPYPIYDARNITTNQILEWLSGTKTISHDVYFGTNRADVNDGMGDTFKGNYLEPEYDPGVLATCNTYYWRIDELDQSGSISKGNVWQFSTYCPDINRDGNIDMIDLVLLISEWLSQTSDLRIDMTPPPYGDNWVDFEDFKVLSKHWLD